MCTDKTQHHLSVLMLTLFWFNWEERAFRYYSVRQYSNQLVSMFKLIKITPETFNDMADMFSVKRSP